MGDYCINTSHGVRSRSKTCVDLRVNDELPLHHRASRCCPRCGTIRLLSNAGSDWARGLSVNGAAKNTTQRKAWSSITSLRPLSDQRDGAKRRRLCRVRPLLRLCRKMPIIRNAAVLYDQVDYIAQYCIPSCMHGEHEVPVSHKL